MNKYLLVSVFFFLGMKGELLANDSFPKVVAKRGDSVYRLLQRYQLDNYACNFTKFYEINQLDREAYLLAGKAYFLPIVIYNFNGKTIRSSVGIDNWQQAVRIKNYNEALLQNKLRQKTIVSSRILWVPFHELNCLDRRIKAEPEFPAVILGEEDTEEIPVLTENKINSKPFKFEYSKTHFSVYSQHEGEPAARHYEKTNRIVPPLNKNRHFAIFGKEYAHVPLIDESLKGQIFYIVSGHGGPDAGAVAKVNRKLLCEDEYAYDVALRLTRNLIAHGATAYMITRDPNDGIRNSEVLRNDTDEYCWGNLKMPRGQKKRLYQRSDMINALYQKHKNQGITQQTVVAIHVDSRSQREQTDLFFYYFPNSASGQRLATTLHKTIKNKYHTLRPGRGYSGTVTPRDLHMLRETPTTSVYVELGNIRNAYDRKRILPASNRQALADWLYQGLAK